MAQTLKILHVLSLRLTFAHKLRVALRSDACTSPTMVSFTERVFVSQYVLICMSFRKWRCLFRAQEIMASLCSHWVPWSATWLWKEQTLLLLLLVRFHKRCATFYLFIAIGQLPSGNIFSVILSVRFQSQKPKGTNCVLNVFNEAIKYLLLITDSSAKKHMCLGEWNSWECSRQCKNNLHIDSTYLQTYTDENVQNTHAYTQYTLCTIRHTSSYQYTLYTVRTHSALCTHIHTVICEGATDYT